MNFRVWQALNRQRFQVDVCFLDEPGAVSAMYQAAGYAPPHLCAHQRPWPQVWRAVRQVMRAQPYAVIYLFGLRANVVGRLASRFETGARLVTGQRSVDGWRRPWHNWLDRWTSRWVTLYIANCRAVERWLRREVGISAEKTLTLYSGLDLAPFTHAPRGRLRAELGLPDTALIITCLANLRRVKNQSLLLTAFAHLPETLPAHLLLVGDGPCRADLEAQMRHLGLSGRVHFLGSRSDVPAILADTQLNALTSDWEGLPGAILEAMAAGCPVVATHVGGVPELVVEGETGLLIPPGDAPALAAALTRLLTNPDERWRLGQAGQARAREHFRLETQVAVLEDVLAAVALGQPITADSTHV